MKILKVSAVMLLAASWAGAVSTIRLDLDRQAINRNAGFNNRDSNLWILTKQFDLMPSTVESRLAAGEDWGQLAVRLAVAWEMVREKNDRYPGINEALNDTQAINFQDKSWTEDAAKLVDLRPVALTVSDLSRQFASPRPFKGEIISPKNTIPPANPIGSSGISARGTNSGNTAPRVQAPRR